MRARETAEVWRVEEMRSPRWGRRDWKSVKGGLERRIVADSGDRGSGEVRRGGRRRRRSRRGSGRACCCVVPLVCGCCVEDEVVVFVREIVRGGADFGSGGAVFEIALMRRCSFAAVNL